MHFEKVVFDGIIVYMKIVQWLRTDSPISKQYKKLDNLVYPVHGAIDKRIAELKLQTLGIQIDTLTPEQKKYLESWEIGT